MDKEGKFKVDEKEGLGSERPLQESYSEMLGSELKNLQKKLNQLETKMNKRTSPASALEKPAKKNLDKGKFEEKIRSRTQKSSKKCSVSMEGLNLDLNLDSSKREKKLKK